MTILLCGLVNGGDQCMFSWSSLPCPRARIEGIMRVWATNPHDDQ
jgi:hypothetical protein